MRRGCYARWRVQPGNDHRVCTPKTFPFPPSSASRSSMPGPSLSPSLARNWTVLGSFLPSVGIRGISFDDQTPIIPHMKMYSISNTHTCPVQASHSKSPTNCVGCLIDEYGTWYQLCNSSGRCDLSRNCPFLSVVLPRPPYDCLS